MKLHDDNLYTFIPVLVTPTHCESRKRVWVKIMPYDVSCFQLKVIEQFSFRGIILPIAYGGVLFHFFMFRQKNVYIARNF